MRVPLFQYPSFQYQVSDWEFKRKGLLKRISKQEFYRTELQDFETDRLSNNKAYVTYLAELLAPELTEFCQEAEVTCSMTEAWTVKYQKGDHQTVHNHRSWGYSGILYVEYDPMVHTPATFVAPWQQPNTDTTFLARPAYITEGTIFIVPSYTLHYVEPNKVRKSRTVISFDLVPDTPQHRAINSE